MQDLNFLNNGFLETRSYPEIQTTKKRKNGFLGKLARLIELVLKALIYLTVLGLPLVFSTQSYDVLALPKQTYLAITVLTSLVLWLIIIVISRNFRMRRTPLDIPILVFGAIYLVASLASVSPMTSILGSYGQLDRSFLTVLYFIIFYYLIVNNIKSKKEIIGLVLTLIMSAFLVAIYSLMQIFGVYLFSTAFTKAITFNTVGTISALSVFIMSVIPVSIAMVLRKKNQSKMSFAGISILFFVLLILVNVKAAWWGLFAACIILVLLSIFEKKVDKKWLVLPALIGLVTLALAFTSGVANRNLPKDTTLDLKNSIGQVTQSIKERPVFGSGPETYSYDFSRFRSADMNNLENWTFRYDKAHNDWLTNGATLGILGTIAYAFLFIMAVVAGIYNYLASTDDDAKQMTLGATATIVAIGTMSFFYYANFALLMVFWLALALIGVARQSQETVADDIQDINLENAPLEAKVFSTVFFILLFFGAIYGVYFNGKTYAADISYRKGLEKTDKAETLKEAEGILDKAINQNGNQPAYRLSLAKVLMVEANLESQKKEGEKDPNKIQDYLFKAIAQGKQAVNKYPNNVGNWEGMIIIYRNAALYATGAVDWVETSYGEALKLEPANPVLLNGLGQVQLTKKDVDKAAESFNKALSLKKDFADPHYNLGIVYSDKQEYARSIAEFEIYLKFVPDSTEAKTEIENVKKLQENKGVTTTEDSTLRGKPAAPSAP